ncbi:hypothetical protein [Olleya sp. R77988]|uniref:hypothetical protein n=1 Tax=Olleya sp. R77988 TaxID=3093875 RepID=UPI0037CA0C14
MFFYKKFKSKAARIFIWFLVYVQFIETFASYPRVLSRSDSFIWFKQLIANTVFVKNYWFYDVFWTIIGTLIISYYFLLVAKNNFLKKVIKYIIICFLIISVSLMIIYYKDLRYNFLLPLEILSLIVILLVVFSYFVELLNSEKILNFYKALSFYIAIGVLVFWLVITPLSFYEQYYNQIDKSFVALKNYVYLLSIVFMYLTFTIGFIVSKPEYD